MLGTEYKKVIYLLNCLFLVRSGDATLYTKNKKEVDKYSQNS